VTDFAWGANLLIAEASFQQSSKETVELPSMPARRFRHFSSPDNQFLRNLATASAPAPAPAVQDGLQDLPGEVDGVPGAHLEAPVEHAGVEHRRLVALAHSRRSPGVSIRRAGGELSSFPAVPAGPEYSLLPLPRIARTRQEKQRISAVIVEDRAPPLIVVGVI
jgi:hypothetical protein